MDILKHNQRKENKKFFVFFNILTFLFLTWICQPYNGTNIPARVVERKYNTGGQLNINFNRLLAKAKVEKKVEQKGLNVKDSVDMMNKEMKNKKKDSPTYEKIKKEKKNDLNYYMKSYKDRYSKRIGLGKLDCYCEKKIFNHIDKMCKFANRADVNKSTFKKKLFKKYGMQIFLTNFFYFISLLIAVFECLFLNNILLDTSNGNTHLISNDIARHIVKTLGDILLYVVPFVLTLVIIYILIKIIKYEKLKSKKW